MNDMMLSPLEGVVRLQIFVGMDQLQPEEASRLVRMIYESNPIRFCGFEPKR